MVLALFCLLGDLDLARLDRAGQDPIYPLTATSAGATTPNKQEPAQTPPKHKEIETMKTEGRSGQRHRPPGLLRVPLQDRRGRVPPQLSAGARALEGAARAVEGSGEGVSGSLTLKLNFAAEEGMLDVRYSIYNGAEAAPRPSVFWQDKNRTSLTKTRSSKSYR